MVHWYPKYVPVGVRRARAAVEMHELRARGVKVQPVEIRDRNIARSFWGQRWCEHLESFSDYANRLPRGRTFVRDGSVCHLAVETGGVEARVAGRELYRVVVRVRQLERPTWKAIKQACAGQIGSVLELLQGRLTDRVMDVVTDRDAGLFPEPGEIKLACDCPDGATMCKHAAAVLYGIGSRLDDSPELLFRLRGVDEAELIAADMALPRDPTADTLADGDLGGIFDIELDAADGVPAPAAPKSPPAPTPRTPLAPTPRTPPAPTVRTPLAPTPRMPLAPTVRTPPAPTPHKLPAPTPRTPLAPTPRTPPAPTVRTPPAPNPAKPKKAQRDRSPHPEPSSAVPGLANTGAAASRYRPTGSLIADLRERCGFSVAEFADILQVSGATVRRWEAVPGPLALRARTREALAALRLAIEPEKRDD